MTDTPERVPGVGRTDFTARKAATEERRMRVSAMLLARVQQREMARRESVSLGTITNDIAVIRRNWRDRMAESYNAHVAEEVAKLDWLERGLMAHALKGDDYDAIDRLIKIMDRRARLLGLDAPTRTRVEVITEDVIDAAIRDLEAKLAAADAPAD